MTSCKNLLLGLDEAELVELPLLHCRVHHTLVTPLLDLRARAAAAGFELQVASSFRSFERQLLIWNNKARGVRPVLDSQGQPLDLAALGDYEKVMAILRWSALPGASRHHWGTDIDVYDKSRMAADYQLQLTLAETCGAGPCAEFHAWLGAELQRAECDFYRPYDRDSGGIAPEPWHLSYAPLARSLAQQFSVALLRAQLQASELELKATVLAHLDEIYTRFIRVDE